MVQDWLNSDGSVEGFDKMTEGPCALASGVKSCKIKRILGLSLMCQKLVDKMLPSCNCKHSPVKVFLLPWFCVGAESCRRSVNLCRET